MPANTLAAKKQEIATMVVYAAQINYEVLKLLLAFILPPWAVYLETGWSRTFWLNLLLTLLGFYPGLLHGVFVFLKHLR
jgi:uncharacterized membrane protein YqaE (UPF0057 family)